MTPVTWPILFRLGHLIMQINQRRRLPILFHQQFVEILVRQRGSHEFDTGRYDVSPPYEPKRVDTAPARAYFILVRLVKGRLGSWLVNLTVTS